MKKKLLFSAIIAAVMFAGTGVYADSCPVKIGSTCYEQIQDAINAVPNDGNEVTIEITQDMEDVMGIGFFNQEKILKDGETVLYHATPATNKNIVFDFKGHTAKMGVPEIGSGSTYNTQNVHLEKGNKATFKNGTIIASTGSGMLFQNYSNLTLQDFTLDASNSAASYALSLNNDEVKILGNTNIYSAPGKYAFDMCWSKLYYPDGTQITVDTTGTIKGKIQLDYWTNAATDTDPKSTLTINNMKHEGSFVIDSGLEGQLTINNGIFDSNIAESYVADTSVTYHNESTGMNVVIPEDELVVMAFDTVLEPTEEQTNKVTEALEQGFVIGKFFDITAWLTNPEDGNAKVEQVEEADEKVKVTLAIPTDLPALQEGYTRIYKVVGIHNGVVTTYGVVDNEDGTISFMTDVFSPYAITYTDQAPAADQEQATNNPKTADKIILYMSALVISAVAVTGTALYLNKRY